VNSLRIGCVKYLNACPLIHGWEGTVDFDHPIYWIVDGVSISSEGPVYSVVVAHQGEIGQIEEIELDPASETSANLLGCLIAELGLDPRLVRRSTVWPTAAESKTGRRARLLIGDQAIRFRQQYANEFFFWDLGEQWQKIVGLPFVYALWLIRPEVADPKQIANRMRALRNENLDNLDDLIPELVAVADPGSQMGVTTREFLSRYYHKHLRFGFGEKEKEGLRIFANLCIKHSLLPKNDFAFRVV
jgi:predicted solute-binding protein